MWGKVAAWWATRAASNYLAAVLIGALGIFAVYVQQLRVRAAECQASKELTERYANLAERLEAQRNAERDRAIQDIKDADHPCLDADVLDLLRGGAVEGGEVP